MAEFSSPLSRENRLQIARSTFSSSAITGGRSLAISPLISSPVPQQDPETLRLLESNQTELISISSGIAGIRNSVDSLNQALSAVSSAIYNNSILDQNREAQKQQQERMLAEDALRDETEALIERRAGLEINNAVQPVAEKTTGTLNSLMGVFGTLFLGWLTTGGIQGVQRLAQESGDRLKQVKDTVGNGLRFIGDGLSNIKNGFDNIIGNVTRVTGNIKDAVVKGLILAPFRAMFGGGGGGGAASGVGTGAASAADDAGKGVASAADDAGKGVASAADDAGKGVASAADDAGKGLRGMGSTLLRGASGLASAAFGGLEFMERKQEGQTNTQAAAGAGGGVVGGEVGALTGARVGSLFGPLGTITGAVLGGAGGWMLGSGIADKFTGVSDEKEKAQQPQTQTQPKPQPQAPPQEPQKPKVTSQAQTPFLSLSQTQLSEKKAEELTPKEDGANISQQMQGMPEQNIQELTLQPEIMGNYGDEMTRYVTQSLEDTAINQGNLSEKVFGWMNSVRESISSFPSLFEFGRKIEDTGKPQVTPESSMIPFDTTIGGKEQDSPVADFQVNFEDQISKYFQNNIQSPLEEIQNQITGSGSEIDLVKMVEDSIASFNLPFNFNPPEAPQLEYKLPQISKAVKSNIPTEKTFGPLPEPPPNIIMAPMQPQQVASSRPPAMSGSATDVPNIPSSNSDNFYIMYSKSQYNVLT